MPQDAIIGARYYDPVYDMEFTVIAVKADVDHGSEIASEQDIQVEMEYDEIIDTMTTNLDNFRNERDIEVVEVPDHAG